MSRIDFIAELMREGQIGCSYRKSIKRHLLKGVPEFEYAVLVRDTSMDPPRETYQTGLKAIPERLTNLGENNHTVLLRQEGYTTLSQIKRFHAAACKSQGIPYAKFLEHCNGVVLSIDGVCEAPHAKRTLRLVTVRFGPKSVYVARVLNYLLKVDGAKPSLDEVLKYDSKLIVIVTVFQLPFFLAPSLTNSSKIRISASDSWWPICPKGISSRVSWATLGADRAKCAQQRPRLSR